MRGHVAVLLFLVATSCRSVQGSVAQRGSEGLDGAVPDDGTNPCNCALINFWDTAPRQEATDCCKALDAMCAENNSLSCGHVHRFCTKQKAGYSAWVLDVFVREHLKDLGTCIEFNPDATHDERCGDGWCRIGYACTKVKAERCREKPGLRCGQGYCVDGSYCAQMSSENCNQMSDDELKKLQEERADEEMDYRCANGRCTVCTVDKEFNCAYEGRLIPPCTGRTCADRVKCGVEEEEVCTVRPEALKDLGAVPGELQPEKVPESKLRRRLTAFVFPALAAMLSVIFVVALLSWVATRVKRAQKEAANQAEADRLERSKSTEMGIKTGTSVHDSGRSLNHPSSRLASKIPLHLPIASMGIGGDPEEGVRISGRRFSKTTPRRWTPRSHYRDLSYVDVDMSIGGDTHGYDRRNQHLVRENLKRTRSRSCDRDKADSGDESTPRRTHSRFGSFGVMRFL